MVGGGALVGSGAAQERGNGNGGPNGDEDLIAVAPTELTLGQGETGEVTVEIQGPPFGRTDVVVSGAPADPDEFRLERRNDSITVEIGPVDENTTVNFTASLPRGDEQTVMVEVKVEEEEDPLPDFLANLATGSGGPVATFPDRDPVPLQQNDTFGDVVGDDESVVTWVTNGDDVVVTSTTGGGATSTEFGPASEDDGFSEIGDTGFWQRAPTGSGTPQPDQGNFELVNVEETDDGYRTDWEEVD